MPDEAGSGAAPQEHREGCLGLHPLGIVAGGNKQLPGDLDTDSDALEQLRSEGFDDRVDQLVEFGDLVGQFQIAAGQGLERDTVRGDRVDGV
jgi:hypothetical protein